MNIVNQITEAESKADAIRQEAAVQARDMVKAAQEASMAFERQSLKSIGEQSQKTLAAMREKTQAEMNTLADKCAGERRAKQQLAEKNVERAGSMIFERVVLNGNR